MAEYLGAEVTFDNYRKVLEGYSVDVQDEVRSALLDGCADEVLERIGLLREDPYSLQQLRLFVKEGNDPELIQYYDGDQIRLLRRLVRDGINVDMYLDLDNASGEYYQVVLELLSDGAVVDKRIDFSRIRSNMLEVVKYALMRGVDIVDILGRHWMTPKYAQNIVWLREHGLPVDRMVADEWNSDAVEAFYESSIYSRAYKEAYRLSDSKSDGEYVRNVVQLVRSKFPDIDAVKGLPGYQLTWIYQCYDEGLNYKPMLEKVFSNSELSDIRAEAITTRSRRLSKRI